MKMIEDLGIKAEQMIPLQETITNMNEIGLEPKQMFDLVMQDELFQKLLSGE